MEANILFTDADLGKMSERFKIMSEPSRLKILRTLFTGEKCVTDIIKQTQLLQANVSKQLKIMERNGVVNCRPQGLQRFYSIKEESILSVCNQICKTVR